MMNYKGMQVRSRSEWASLGYQPIKGQYPHVTDFGEEWFLASQVEPR